MNCFKVAFSTQCCATIACIWFQNTFITPEEHLVRGGFEIVSSEVHDITPNCVPTSTSSQALLAAHAASASVDSSGGPTGSSHLTPHEG